MVSVMIPQFDRANLRFQTQNLENGIEDNAERCLEMECSME